MPYSPDTPPRAADVSFVEFVAQMALLMALTALSIDIMLVALPDIAHTFAVETANDRQLVVIVYLLGFAVGQPIHGPPSDRFGRKPVLAVGLAIFVLASVGAALAPGFEALLGLRALQGLGAAAPRIVAMAVVRDRFHGRDMARVMSFVMMVFITIPVVAPAIGEAVVIFASWPWIFGALALVGVAGAAWTGFRLPETHPPANRMRLTGMALWNALAMVVGTRRTLGYTVATGFIFGCLLAYVSSAQQIFVDVYKLGDLFPLAFGAIAAVMAVAALANAQLVGPLGMRRVSHAAMVVSLVLNWLAFFTFSEQPPLLLFGLLAAAAFFCFGLIMPNFNALAMEPLGRVAGMGSSFVGFYTTAAGAATGWLVGGAFDGTVRPLITGFAVATTLTVVTVLVTEGGRLFQAADSRTPPPPSAH